MALKTLIFKIIFILFFFLFPYLFEFQVIYGEAKVIDGEVVGRGAIDMLNTVSCPSLWVSLLMMSLLVCWDSSCSRRP